MREQKRTQTAEVPFEREIIDSADSSPANPYGKAIGDLNGDGQPDLFISSALDGGMCWYKYPTWEKQIIQAEGSWSEDCQIFDIDGDGDNDVVNGNKQGLFWYENPKNQSDMTNDTIWVGHLIGSDGTNIHDLEIADMNGDGKPDIAIRYEKEYQKPVCIFLQKDHGLWLAVTNTNTSFRKGEGMALADLDKDGDIDMALGYIWLENVRLGTDWYEHQYALNMPEQVLVRIADINKDGNQEIIIAPQSKQQGNFSWYAAEKDRTAPWTEFIIKANISHMHSLALADFNLDGNLDIHTAIRHDHPGSNDNVSIWLSNRMPVPQFIEQVIDTIGSHYSKIEDIGQDGDMDIFGANWKGTDGPSANIYLWTNQLN